MRHSTAELWLMAWGETVRDRGGFWAYRPTKELDRHGKKRFERFWVEGGGVGHGVSRHGEYSRSDDPHNSSWVMIQVGALWPYLSEEHRAFLTRCYVEGRSLFSLRHEFKTHWRARQIRREVLEIAEAAVIRTRDQRIGEAYAKLLAESGIFEGPGWQHVIAWLNDHVGVKYAKSA